MNLFSHSNFKAARADAVPEAIRPVVHLFLRPPFQAGAFRFLRRFNFYQLASRDFVGYGLFHEHGRNNF